MVSFHSFWYFLFHSIRQYLNILASGRQNTPKFSKFMNKVHCHCSWIARVNEYPTMHNFGIPRHTQSMITYDFDRVFLEISMKNCIMRMLFSICITYLWKEQIPTPCVWKYCINNTTILALLAILNLWKLLRVHIYTFYLYSLYVSAGLLVVEFIVTLLFSVDFLPVDCCFATR